MQKIPLVFACLACVAFRCHCEVWRQDKRGSSVSSPRRPMRLFPSWQSHDDTSRSSDEPSVDASKSLALFLLAFNSASAFALGGPRGLSPHAWPAALLDNLGRSSRRFRLLSTHDDVPEAEELQAEDDENSVSRRSMLGWTFSSGAALTAASHSAGVAKAEDENERLLNQVYAQIRAEKNQEKPLSDAGTNAGTKKEPTRPQFARPTQDISNEEAVENLIASIKKDKEQKALRGDGEEREYRGLNEGIIKEKITLRARGENVRPSALPVTGFGTLGLPKDKVGPALKSALDAGCLHIDCAPIFLNELEVGKVLANWLDKNDRQKLFVSSKLWNDRRRPRDVRQAVEQTLNDLGLNYLDLYIIQWPVVWEKGSSKDPKPDPEASLRETWQTLEQLVNQGKIKNLGVSNYDENQLRELLGYAQIKPAVLQIEMHPRLPQSDLVVFCRNNGIAVTAYSPLGKGNLQNAQLLSDEIVKTLAARKKVSPASILLRWNIQRGVAVIPRTSNPKHAAQNENEPWTFQLTDAEMDMMDECESGQRETNPSWYTFANKKEADSRNEGFFNRLKTELLYELLPGDMARSM